MKDLENKVRKYLKDRNWDELRPSDVAKSISIEAAELLEIFQWSNPTLEAVKNDKEKVATLKKELADILIYALDLSVLLNFDTQQIILEKLRYAEEKYPAHLMKKRGNAEPGTEEEYLKIKKKYRRQGLS